MHERKATDTGTRSDEPQASGDTARARAEAAIGRFKQGIGDGLRSRNDDRRATEGDIAAHALSRMMGRWRINQRLSGWAGRWRGV